MRHLVARFTPTTSYGGRGPLIFPRTQQSADTEPSNPPTLNPAIRLTSAHGLGPRRASDSMASASDSTEPAPARPFWTGRAPRAGAPGSSTGCRMTYGRRTRTGADCRAATSTTCARWLQPASSRSSTRSSGPIARVSPAQPAANWLTNPAGPPMKSAV